jgi:hypothetical protein
VFDEPGYAGIWKGRNASCNQAGQTGLNDAEDKMAVTAGNAKVHGSPSQLRMGNMRPTTSSPIIGKFAKDTHNIK